MIFLQCPPLLEKAAGAGRFQIVDCSLALGISRWCRSEEIHSDSLSRSAPLTGVLIPIEDGLNDCAVEIFQVPGPGLFVGDVAADPGGVADHEPEQNQQWSKHDYSDDDVQPVRSLSSPDILLNR